MRSATTISKAFSSFEKTIAIINKSRPPKGMQMIMPSNVVIILALVVTFKADLKSTFSPFLYMKLSKNIIGIIKTHNAGYTKNIIGAAPFARAGDDNVINRMAKIEKVAGFKLNSPAFFLVFGF